MDFEKDKNDQSLKRSILKSKGGEKKKIKKSVSFKDHDDIQRV